MSLLRIFTYHNIGTPPPGASAQQLYVSIENFDRQCWLLQRLGIRGVGIGAGMAALANGQSGKLVVLSFDDGYLDNLVHAAPILRTTDSRPPAMSCRDRSGVTTAGMPTGSVSPSR